jgi:hypothetical protein
MHAILCDVSREPIEGEAWEIQLIHGRAVVNPDTGHSRIVQRDGATVLYLSEPVGRWLLTSLDQMRVEYARQRGAAA